MPVVHTNAHRADHVDVVGVSLLEVWTSEFARAYLHGDREDTTVYTFNRFDNRSAAVCPSLFAFESVQLDGLGSVVQQ